MSPGRSVLEGRCLTAPNRAIAKLALSSDNCSAVTSVYRPLAWRRWPDVSFVGRYWFWFVSALRAFALLWGTCRPYGLAFRLTVYSPAVFQMYPKGMPSCLFV